MSVGELKGALQQLPKLVSQLIAQININLARIRNCRPEALRES